jgi:hypothetical protein
MVALGAASWLATPAATAPTRIAAEGGDSAVSCRRVTSVRGDASDCLLGGGDAPPVAALWGDSHALHLAAGFANAFGARGETVAGYFLPSCPPLPGVLVSTNLFNASRDCEKRNADVLAVLLASPSIRTVYLGGRWAAYTEAQRFGRESKGRYYLVDAAHRFPSIATSRLLLRDQLIALARTLSEGGKKVVLIAQTPEMGFDAGRCFRLLDPATAERRCVVLRASVVERRRAADAAIGAAREAVPQMRLVDPLPFLCDNTVCYAVRSGVGLYGDFHHLSVAAASQLVPELLRQEQIEADGP